MFVCVGARTKFVICSLRELVFYHEYFRATRHLSGCIIHQVHHKLHTYTPWNEYLPLTCECRRSRPLAATMSLRTNATKDQLSFVSVSTKGRNLFPTIFLTIAQKFQYSHIFLQVHTLPPSTQTPQALLPAVLAV